MSGPADWTFTFTVAAQNGAPEADDMEGDVTKAEPTYTFGPFEYTKPGTYTYQVSESGTVNGVTNEDVEYKTVTVNVVENADATLTATVSSTEDKPLTFTNDYNVGKTTARV